MHANGLTDAIRRHFAMSASQNVDVRKHSWGVRKHSRGLAKIRNTLLTFLTKAYSQHIREQS